MYAKLSRKGQVTIPKLIREKLMIEKEGGILFLIEDGEVKLKGVPSGQVHQMAGSLKKYAKKYVPLRTIRTDIKRTIANEASREGLPD